MELFIWAAFGTAITTFIAWNENQALALEYVPIILLGSICWPYIMFFAIWHNADEFREIYE